MHTEAPSNMKAFQANLVLTDDESAQASGLSRYRNMIVLAEDYSQACDRVADALLSEAQLAHYDLGSIAQISDSVAANWIVLTQRNHGDF